MTHTNELNDHFVSWSADLIHTMGEASNDFKSSDDIQHQREVLRAFILSLTDLLRDFPIPEEHLCTLQVLGKSLVDLSNGIKTPLFVHEKKPGRPGSDADSRRLRARAVLYVRLLKYHSVKAKDAEKEVAFVLSNAGHVGRNGGPMNRDLLHQWDEKAHPSARANEHKLVLQLLEDFRRNREDSVDSVRRNLAIDPVIHGKVIKPL